MEKIAIITLGCKTNQYESQALGEILAKKGHEVEYGFCKADIYILNTCAVTNEAERKSRQTITKLTKLNPNCKIFVCGCASQNNPEQFSKHENVRFVSGNANRLGLIEHIEGKSGKNIEKLPNVYEDIHISKPTNARSYIKIQDGCNRFCSYCLIPYLRGRSRSRSIISVLQEIDRLAKCGTKEIILTGIDISDYKIDDKPALLDLLQQIDNYNVRYRLGSIEPNILTKEFIHKLRLLKNLCPHFHISMQSGCNETLKRMNRHYTTKFFIERIKLLRKHFPNCSITTDVILGFPSESDKEFAQTVETVKKIQFSEMHIFPYSRRTGTTADKLLTDKQNRQFIEVPPQITKSRMKTMLAIAETLKTKYLKKQKNKILEAVIEEKTDNLWVGTTENYVKVYLFSSCQSLENTIQKIKVIKLFKDGVWATIV